MPVQIEEDTDRDRYMSPLEAKNYGLIDEVIGGDEAGFQITGTTRDFPKTKESYVNWVRLSLPVSSQTCAGHNCKALLLSCAMLHVVCCGLTGSVCK